MHCSFVFSAASFRGQFLLVIMAARANALERAKHMLAKADSEEKVDEVMRQITAFIEEQKAIIRSAAVVKRVTAEKKTEHAAQQTEGCCSPGEDSDEGHREGQATEPDDEEEMWYWQRPS